MDSFLGRDGNYFLKRPRGERGILPFAEPSVALTHVHIMGRRPPTQEYMPHPKDAGPLKTAEDLSWRDFVKLTTGEDDFTVPPSVRRMDAAWVLEEFTSPSMLQEAFHVLGVYGILQRNADKRKTQEDDLLLSLASLWLDAADEAAPVDGAV